MKPYVQAVFLGPVPFQNAMVVTVGKSWASMHSDQLPHGDPGATAIASPALGVGPIYFNAAVFPDPGQTTTSVDGGVTWLNMPLNHTYYVTAEKDGVNYPTVKFKINEADLAYGVELYIASPPDSVQGTTAPRPGSRKPLRSDRMRRMLRPRVVGRRMAPTTCGRADCDATHPPP